MPSDCQDDTGALDVARIAETFRNEAKRFEREETREAPAEAFRRDRGPWLMGLLDKLARAGSLPYPIRRRMPSVGLPLVADARWPVLVAGLVQDDPDTFAPDDAAGDWHTYEPVGPMQWTRAGKQMPEGWDPTRDGGGIRPGDRGSRDSRRTTGDGYTDESWRCHHADRCRTHAAVCRWIAELIQPEQAAGDSPSGGPPRAEKVVLWEGAPHTERNIRLARTRTAYLEAHGNAPEALKALDAAGHRIGRSTLYDHLNVLDEECPGWRDYLGQSGVPGIPDNCQASRTRRKAGDNAR